MQSDWWTGQQTKKTVLLVTERFQFKKPVDPVRLKIVTALVRTPDQKEGIPVPAKNVYYQQPLRME